MTGAPIIAWLMRIAHNASVNHRKNIPVITGWRFLIQESPFGNSDKSNGSGDSGNSDGKGNSGRGWDESDADGVYSEASGPTLNHKKVKGRPKAGRPSSFDEISIPSYPVAVPTNASIWSGCDGMSAERFWCPLPVTSTLSSMRMPIPFNAAGDSVASGPK
jgi:hypothetical protein